MASKLASKFWKLSGGGHPNPPFLYGIFHTLQTRKLVTTPPPPAMTVLDPPLKFIVCFPHPTHLHHNLEGVVDHQHKRIHQEFQVPLMEEVPWGQRQVNRSCNLVTFPALVLPTHWHCSEISMFLQCLTLFLWWSDGSWISARSNKAFFARELAEGSQRLSLLGLFKSEIIFAD